MVQFYEDPTLMGILITIIVIVILICGCFCYSMCKKEHYDSHTGRFIGVISIDSKNNTNKYYRRQKQIRLSRNPMMEDNGINKDSLKSISVISSPENVKPFPEPTIIAPTLTQNSDTITSNV